MEAKDLRKKTEKELQELLFDLRKKLVDLRFQKIQGKLKNPHQIKFIRKDIARILTVLNERRKEK